MKKLIFIAVLLLVAAQIGMADVNFQPQNSTTNVGGSVTVDVMISGVDGPWLGGYDIIVSYDPTILNYVGVAWPYLFLGASTVPFDFDLGSGSVEVLEVSTLKPPELEAAQDEKGPFGLFQLTFSGKAPGVSPLTFDWLLLSDELGASPLPFGDTPAGSITVVGAPEPNTVLFLLVLGFGSLAILRRYARA
jgi:hypothetical protein